MWWDVANERRARLILKKYKAGQGLTLAEESEYRLLQAVAEEILNHGERMERVKSSVSK